MLDFLAGAISGVCQIAVGFPFDTVKVHIQNNEPIRHLQYNQYFRGIQYPLLSSSLINGMLFSIFNTSQKYIDNSVVCGFLAGSLTSPVIFMFDVAKTTRQLGAKHSMKRFLTRHGFPCTVLRESLAFATYFPVYSELRKREYSSLTSGGVAGLMNWTLTYPIDVLRNRQVGKNISFRQAYELGNLWKGYSVCAVRAVLVNSVGFWVYERCMDSFA